MKVGIINVTGYAGMELARILHRHPEVEIAAATGRSQAGKRLGEVFPHLSACDVEITPDIVDSVDFVFSALPHAASAERLEPFIDDGVKAVDISADFRLKDLDEYTGWYKITHPCPQYVETAVYGLTELHRDEIAQSNLVGNPRLLSVGCNFGHGTCCRGWHHRGRCRRGRQVWCVRGGKGRLR